MFINNGWRANIFTVTNIKITSNTIVANLAAKKLSISKVIALNPEILLLKTNILFVIYANKIAIIFLNTTHEELIKPLFWRVNPLLPDVAAI